MAATTLVVLTTILLSGVSLANAETHTVRFDNQCVYARFFSAIDPILITPLQVRTWNREHARTSARVGRMLTS